jgi:glycosyltransferase involved in cell wall biosynthesis
LSYFGLLNSSKGLETLLEAFRQLRAGMPSIKLLMVGAGIGDSDPTNAVYQQKILKLIDDLALRDMVIFTGYVVPTDVSAHLMASDICVLPFRDGASFRRGSLMAALAHGLPIVTTKAPVINSPHTEDTSGLLPKLVHGENCLLISPGDDRALVEAVRQLMDSPKLRKMLAEGASQLAKNFSWERIAQETVGMYRSILKQEDIPC